MRRNLILLGLYWFVASSSFFWELDRVRFFSCLDIIEIFLWILLALVILLWSVYRLHHRPMLVLFLPLAMPMLCLAQTIYLTKTFYLRTAFCAYAITGFILSFNILMFFEKKSDWSKGHADLVHRRYIEYFRTFVWLVLFGIVSYLGWELNAFGHSQPLPGAPQTSPIIGLFQLVCVFTLGLMLVIYAFHVRLKEIEERK